jgi:DNA (cytosine-5)-methyltransferase 1
MLRAGFDCLAAIDFNPQAISTLKANLLDRPHPTLPAVRNALERDLTQYPPWELAALLGTDRVDVIVGGPPCQGFSTARRRDGANHGLGRMVQDARRSLYQQFLRYVDHFYPKVFVMENVLGIRSAAGGEYFTRVQKEARQLGYRVHSQMEDAWKLGVPQKRRRQLIIGTRQDLPEYFRPGLQRAPHAVPEACLGAAIGDLPVLRAGQGEDVREYDMQRRRKHLRKWKGIAKRYLQDVLEIGQARLLTNHVARPHSDRDLRDFARLREGESSTVAMRDRGVKFEFPYDKSHFKDRYTRQSRSKPCSTIVAHLSKDGLMFIHPTQNRSLTPREAARVQSFPDWFRFPESRTQAYRLIGNAVPPLIGEAVGITVKSYLEGTMMESNPIRYMIGPLPENENQAVGWLMPLVHAVDKKMLRKISAEEFRLGWYAIGYLYPGLHPDEATEHGDEQSSERDNRPGIWKTEPRLLAPCYVQSGWPVVLAPIAREAYRRYTAQELKDEEYYCGEAVIAGMVHRSPELADEVRKERERTRKESRRA